MKLLRVDPQQHSTIFGPFQKNKTDFRRHFVTVHKTCVYSYDPKHKLQKLTTELREASCSAPKQPK